MRGVAIGDALDGRHTEGPYAALRAGFVLRDSDGAQLSDGVCCKQIRRICRRAGLPERGGTFSVTASGRTS